MVTTVKALCDCIRTLQEEVRKADGKSVLASVKIGGLLIYLTLKTGEQWVTAAQELGYDRRTAARMKRVAKSWWKDGGLERTGFHKDLPSDIHKLEMLCELTREQLATLVAGGEIRHKSRATLAETIRKIKGKTPRPSTVSPVSSEKILKQSDKLVDDFRLVIDQAATAIDDASQRRDILAIFREQLQELDAAVQEELEAPDPSIVTTDEDTSTPSEPPADEDSDTEVPDEDADDEALDPAVEDDEDDEDLLPPIPIRQNRRVTAR